MTGFFSKRVSLTLKETLTHVSGLATKQIKVSTRDTITRGITNSGGVEKSALLVPAESWTEIVTRSF